MARALLRLMLLITAMPAPLWAAPAAPALAAGASGAAAPQGSQADVAPPQGQERPPALANPLKPPPPLGAAALLGEEPLAIGTDPAILRPLRPDGAQPPPPPAGSAAVATPAPSAPASDLAPIPPDNRELVLDRRRRQLSLLENGRVLRRFPVAVGMPGWETPVGRFQVLNKTVNPIWEHPEKGTQTPPGPANPLGSRWIGFYRDCKGRHGWDGEQVLDVKGCVVAGFHGTPHRWTVGRPISHGCVRLYDEDVRALFELVSLGTPVTVLP